MSYSIDEGILDQERQLAAMRAIREKYPDARMFNGEWEAPCRQDAERVTVRNGDLHAVALVGGMYVYDHYASHDIAVALEVLRGRHPDAYAKLVAIVAGRDSTSATEKK
jgi:hypothetical protein